MIFSIVRSQAQSKLDFVCFAVNSMVTYYFFTHIFTVLINFSRQLATLSSTRVLFDACTADKRSEDVRQG